MKSFAELLLCSMIPGLGLLALIGTFVVGLKAFKSAVDVAIAIASQPKVLKVVEA
jgi:hypothetical protein